MRALSYHGPGRITWEPVADPEITHDLDAVIRVDTVTICGTDLHISRVTCRRWPAGGSSATKRSGPWWPAAA